MLLKRRRGPGKTKTKILTRRKILDGVKDPGDRRCLETKARVCPGTWTCSF